jgi:uncharacterized protein (DUF1501 family)
MNSMISRRDVLRSASVLAMAGLLPASLRSAEWVSRAVASAKYLVLIELEGGNDGLNTVVPYLDAVYTAKRKQTKLTVGNADVRKAVIPFSTFSAGTALPAPAGWGVHNSFGKLQDAWRAGDMAIVHNVGYANPNRSHFRGIDIWASGATDDQPRIGTGWLGRMFQNETTTGFSADQVLIDANSSNPGQVQGFKVLSMSKPKDFLDRSDDLTDPTSAQLTAAQSSNAALYKLLLIQKDVVSARNQLQTAVNRTPAPFTTTFPNNGIGRQANHVATCIAGGFSCPYYKIAIGGFDNHTNQFAKHADLLDQLASAIKALREALVQANKWNDTLIMTYSEFGRRVGENDSGGTDHGTAAPQFFFGGAVNGGIYGTAPSLTSLDPRGDLIYSTDMRQMFATCGSWLGITPANRDAALDPFNTPAVTTYAPLAVI